MKSDIVESKLFNYHNYYAKGVNQTANSQHGKSTLQSLVKFICDLSSSDIINVMVVQILWFGDKIRNFRGNLEKILNFFEIEKSQTIHQKITLTISYNDKQLHSHYSLLAASMYQVGYEAYL